MRYLFLAFTFLFFLNSSGKSQRLFFAAVVLQAHESNSSNTGSFKIYKQNKSSKPLFFRKLLKRSFVKHDLNNQEKKTVNRLGFISLASGTMTILCFVLTGIVSSGITLFAILSLLFAGVAITTGIISLVTRKKLSDKKGAKKAPAILGILLGGGLLLAFIITFIYIAINGF